MNCHLGHVRGRYIAAEDDTDDHLFGNIPHMGFQGNAGDIC